MPRRALRCVVDLSLHAVSAPGVWLPSKEDLYLSVSMFGQYRNSRLMTSVFPLLVHEKFRFEKTYYTALDPSEVSAYLDDELVIFELVQLSEYTDGAVRLASFSTNARDFLYPYPSLAPTYSSTDREVLLTRTVAFPGISPKLEFATKTVIRESLSPQVDALEDALESERVLRRSRSARRSPVRRSRSASLASLVSSGRSCSLASLLNTDTSDRDYSQPTVSSIIRSRSISPTRRYVSTDLYDTIDPRPPFVVRKLGKDLIGRSPGNGPDSHGMSKLKSTKKSFVRSSDDLDLSRSSLKLDKVLRSSFRDLPVYKSKFDDEDAEVAALTSSRLSTSLYRPRSASPVLYRQSFRERYGLRPYSPLRSYSPTRPYSPTYYSILADRVRRRIEDERRDARISALTSSYTYSPTLDRLDRLRLYSPYYWDDLSDLELSTSLARSRSPERESLQRESPERESLVHVDRGHYWKPDAAELSGKTHRELFTSNLNKSYHRLYRNSTS